MELSIHEAAAILGKSPRTVRHLLQTGKLVGHKRGRSWRIARDSLPAVSATERESRREQIERVRHHVDGALERITPPTEKGAKRGFYSVRELSAHRIGHEILGMLVAQASGGGHDRFASILTSLHGYLRSLADGTHQYRQQIKHERLVAARSHACAALADTLAYNAIHATPDLTAVADRIEKDLLGSLSGLIKRAESRAR